MFGSRINKEGNIDYRLRSNILHKYFGAESDALRVKQLFAESSTQPIQIKTGQDHSSSEAHTMINANLPFIHSVQCMCCIELDNMSIIVEALWSHKPLFCNACFRVHPTFSPDEKCT